MTLRPLLSTLALTGALALAACGGNDETTAASEEQTTPEQAIAEIGAVRDSLDRAVQAVKDGDAGRADEILADGYVEHFELVEGPLEEVDAELNEELEEALSHDIRDQVKGGASAKEVEALVDDVKADLETAERKLR
jgi:high-affinity iron transporter